MAARSSSSSSDDVLSEGSDSNALNLYDNDGDNSEPLGESGPCSYQHEPRRVHRNDPHEDSTEPVDSDADRLGNTDWCECGTCQPMPTTHESVCCAEIGQVWQKVEEQRPETQMTCITEYSGFQSTCHDVWMLETAYYAYRQQYGTDNHTQNEKFRYIAYRQLARWGYLGKKVRVALPSSAVNKIRSTFPADFGTSYTGLKPPNL
ncbi:P2X purinoceptor 7-like [Stylophora pistillata]|uniref:P2X purinoceptor 7-like n=1 Tax=Stylophora pistillata TaxID=50429 RepID=UPI000C0553A1|nr:P2X purinoceptor 7-like [Stylophora pistillata]